MKFSIFPTLKGYKKEYLLKDIFTGIIITAVSIPISMGYSEIAGLPAVYGLYASVLPILVFALFSTSPQVDRETEDHMINQMLEKFDGVLFITSNSPQLVERVQTVI